GDLVVVVSCRDGFDRSFQRPDRPDDPSNCQKPKHAAEDQCRDLSSENLPTRVLNRGERFLSGAAGQFFVVANPFAGDLAELLADFVEAAIEQRNCLIAASRIRQSDHLSRCSDPFEAERLILTQQAPTLIAENDVIGVVLQQPLYIDFALVKGEPRRFALLRRGGQQVGAHVHAHLREAAGEISHGRQGGDSRFGHKTRAIFNLGKLIAGKKAHRDQHDQGEGEEENEAAGYGHYSPAVYKNSHTKRPLATSSAASTATPRPWKRISYCARVSRLSSIRRVNAIAK